MIESLPHISEAIAHAVLKSLWVGSGIGVFSILITGLLKSPSTRHFISLLAMLSIASLFLTSFIKGLAPPLFEGPKTEVRTAPNQESPKESAFSHIAESPESISPDPKAENKIAGELGQIGQAETFFIRAEHWIAGLWIIGVFILSIRHFAAGFLLMRWRREGTTAPSPELLRSAKRIGKQLQLGLQIPIRISCKVATPILTGTFKPLILLPLSVVNGLTADEVSAIIAHELAHLKRRDSWTNAVQITIETLLFFHPLVWWLGRRMRNDRELAADDLVLKCGTEKAVFARALTALAELQIDAPAPALAASGGSLLRRIQRIARKEHSPPRPTIFGGTALTALVLFATALFSSTLLFAQTDTVINVSPGQSIQDAIGKASPGSVIQLLEGEYTGRLRISKSLTLKGAGWEKTKILPPDDGEIVSTIQIKDAKKFALDGIRVSPNEAPGKPGKIKNDYTILIENSTGSVTNCAIVGPGTNGIVARAGSELMMSKSLVVAFWGTGVAVSGMGEEEKASRLHLKDSVVRSCNHRGITLGRGCDNSIIERNWISGSAWHGIRYDHASPRIERNVIFDNARSGIYASGTSSARVLKNLFAENEMNGISCWYNNTDTIRENIFVENTREAIGVLGDSKPEIDSNWFLDQDTGIKCSFISGDSKDPPSVGNPKVTANLFLNVEQALISKTEQQTLPEGNQTADNTAEEEWTERLIDFGPAAGSDQIVAYVLPGGPANLIGGTPFPRLLPEEKRFQLSPPSRKKSAKEPTREEIQKSYESVQPWIDDAFQLNDPATRDLAIESVRKAIGSKDRKETRKGLLAFNRLEPIRFDKASFHDIILPYLDSDEVFLRKTSIIALGISGLQDGDLDKLISMVDDPFKEVRENLSWQIVQGAKNDLTGKAGAAILKLLEDNDYRFRKTVMNHMWGAKLSPKLETRIIELSRLPESSYDALYYALSTQANKSKASVERLIEFLPDQDTVNVGHRAAWGLGQGVAKSEHSMIANAAFALVEGREGGLYRDGMSLLKKYVSAEQKSKIEELLAKPGVGGEFRKELEALLKSLP